MATATLDDEKLTAIGKEMKSTVARRWASALVPPPSIVFPHRSRDGYAS